MSQAHIDVLTLAEILLYLSKHVSDPFIFLIGKGNDPHRHQTGCTTGVEHLVQDSDPSISLAFYEGMVCSFALIIVPVNEGTVAVEIPRQCIDEAVHIDVLYSLITELLCDVPDATSPQELLVGPLHVGGKESCLASTI